jgi:hypothetical protein
LGPPALIASLPQGTTYKSQRDSIGYRTLAGDQQQESRKTVLLIQENNDVFLFVAGPLASESAASTILILNDLSRPQQCGRRSYDNRYAAFLSQTPF